MPIDRKSDQIYPLVRGLQLNIQPPLHPRKGASLEALGRLAQEIARILKRLHTEAKAVLITSSEASERVTTAHRGPSSLIFTYANLQRAKFASIRKARNSSLIW